MPFTKSSILKSIKSICAKFDVEKPKGSTYKALKMDCNVAGLIKYLVNEINGAEFSAFHVQKRTRVIILQGYFELINNKDLYTVIEDIADFLQNSRSEVISSKSPSKTPPKTSQPKEPSFDYQHFYDIYRSSLFRVYLSSTSFLFRIDQKSDEILRLMKSNEATTATFLSAYAPFSDTVGSEANAKANKNLLEHLNKKKFKFYYGVAVDPSRRWPGEPGFLVFGLSPDSAQALGKACFQQAITQVDISGIPKMIYLPGFGYNYK
jgi:hypothetical protein